MMENIHLWQLVSALLVVYGGILTLLVVPTRNQVQELDDQHSKYSKEVSERLTAVEERIIGQGGTLKRHEKTVELVPQIATDVAVIKKGMEHLSRKVDALPRKINGARG